MCVCLCLCAREREGENEKSVRVFECVHAREVCAYESSEFKVLLSFLFNLHQGNKALVNALD